MMGMHIMPTMVPAIRKLEPYWLVEFLKMGMKPK
jgi:hypothetical protein